MTHALLLGANGAIGNAIATRLVAAGHDVTLVSRDHDRLHELARRLSEGDGPRVEARAVEACEDAALMQVIDEAGRLDVAVNNIGTAHAPAALRDLGAEELDRVLNVGLRAVGVALAAELRAMSTGGAVVNVVSTAGTRGVPGMSAYAAAKHGVVGLTRSVALEEAARGVRVNAVAPGPIDSGGLAKAPPEHQHRAASSVALKRLGSADEVAGAVAWLTSREASYVTGTVLEVDGGRHP